MPNLNHIWKYFKVKVVNTLTFIFVVAVIVVVAAAASAAAIVVFYCCCSVQKKV